MELTSSLTFNLQIKRGMRENSQIINIWMEKEKYIFHFSLNQKIT